MTIWRRPQARALVVLTLLALVLAACQSDEGGGGAAGSGECPDNLSIAFFGALTGPNAALGINIKNGAQLALDQYMATNPDCAIKLDARDSQGSEDQAPALAQSIIQDAAIVGVVGPAFSGETRNATPIFDQAGLPIVTPSATNPELSTHGWTVFHRIVGTDADQAPAAAAYLTGTVGASKVFVIDDRSEYGKGLADGVRSELGDVLAGSDSIDPNAQDYSSTVNKVKAASPDAVYFGGYYDAAGRLVKQLRDAGVDAVFMSGDGSKDPTLIEVAGKAAAEGVIVTCPCAPAEQVQNAEQFIADYEAAFGQAPGTFTAEGYDAMNVFIEAVKQGNTTRESIQEFLGTVSFEGITKTIKFDETGEVAEQVIYAYKVEDGKIVGAGAIEQ